MVKLIDMLSKSIAQNVMRCRMSGPSFTVFGKHISRTFSNVPEGEGIAIPEKELRMGQLVMGGLAIVGVAAFAHFVTTPPVRYAYIHGFASGPKATKGMMLRSCFETNGLYLVLPDMNQPSFESMTCTASLKEMDRVHEQAIMQAGRPVKWCLIGSSMGSYMAARWAELHPDRVSKLVLLSPAFWPTKVVEGIMPKKKTLKDWQKKGSWPWPGPDGTPSEVHWGLMADFEKHPAQPNVPCETLIIHGKNDPIVPINVAEEYTAGHNERVKLVVMDDDHGLVKSMPDIVKLISQFFQIKPELTPPPPPKHRVAQFDHSQK